MDTNDGVFVEVEDVEQDEEVKSVVVLLQALGILTAEEELGTVLGLSHPSQTFDNRHYDLYSSPGPPDST